MSKDMQKSYKNLQRYSYHLRGGRCYTGISRKKG